MLLALVMGVGQMWGAINNTTVTKTGGSQKYLDVATTAASEGDEVTVSEQYIAYTVNELVSSAIKGVWYTQSSSGSGSSNTDAVSITGYRSTCSKYIGISSSKKYTHYVTNCVSFSALYDPRGGSRYCTITATNVDDEEDIVTITNSGTVSSGTKYNVALTGLSASKYYRVVVETNNGSDSRLYQIRLEAPATTSVCPETLTISSKDSKTAFTEGDAIELTAALAKGNGDITYQWYKGGTAEGNKLTGKTTNKLQIASCTTSDAGSYYCVASKAGCDKPAVNASGFAITVEADPKCFNMPTITSKPDNLAAILVTGGTLEDANATVKALEMDAKGIKLGGSAARLKVTLSSSSIVENTKITVTYECTSDKGSGIAIYNGDYASKTMDKLVSGKGSGSWEHTFTAAQAANYADDFIIDRNAGGGTMIVRAITVENCGPAVTKHTVTLNYNDGVTPEGSLKVVDGNAAVKPADPTRGKYTFLGWFVGDTDNEYVWSTAVTGDITLKAHWQDPWTLTFDADGGSEVANITVKHNTKAEKPTDPTKDDNDFLGWFYGDPAVEFDWDANVTQNYALVAHWQPAVAKYDVEYYDGDTKIGTELQVWANQHPTAAGIETSKPLYTFVGWYLTSALEGDPVALNTVTPVEGLKLYGKWTKAYATSYDMEAYAVSDGATLETLLSNLDAAGYAYTNVNDIDNGHTHNYIYDGMKYKTNDGDLSFNVNAGKLVIVKTGNLPANALTMYINGVADPTVFVGANEAVETHVNNYFYSEAEALYRLDIQASKGTCAIKAVTITDPFTVSFDANGGDDVASLNGTPSVTLPLPEKGTESFLGWFDGETKVGEAGEKYTPTANITLKAHWEAVSTDARLSAITFSSDAGTLSPAFDPEVTSYTYTMPYGTAAVPTITGATKANPAAKDPVIDAQAAAWGETAHVHGVAASDDTKDYYVQMLRAPKDGVCIIKTTINSTTKNSIGEVTGLYKKDASCGGLSGYKFNGKGAYIGIELVAGQTFNEGDVINVHTTTAAEQGTIALYNDHGNTVSAFHDYGVMGGAGDNKFALPASAEEKSLIYVCRTEANTWNGFVDYIEVTRPMNPVLTAIQFNSTDVEVTSTTVAALLPQGTNLGTMTVTPTIYWNGAGTAEVTSNEGAWAWGANTYRVTDKDGDYTEYTITLTEDELKHTVSFNTHGGSTIDPVQVVDGQKLAAAPADPTKDENVFKFWSETEDGAEVDVTTVQINADKEFHAVWEAEPEGIKLFDGEGNLNTTNFISPAKTTIEINEVEHVCLEQFSSNRTSLGGATPADMVQYNATTDEAKIKMTFYNNNSGTKKAILYKLEEGGEPTKIEIEVPGQTIFTTDYYEFNSSKNRSFYVCMNDRSNIRVLQVKVIDNGSAIHQAGQAGYSATFNKGRMYVKSGTPATFEGMTLNTSSEYKVYNNSNIATTSYIQFNNAVAGTILKVTRSGGNYYVSQDPEEKGTIYNANAEVELTATGTWYLGSQTSGSAASFTKIEFIAPKCKQPQFNALANSDICSGDPYVALNGTATVADAGVPTYKWYAEGADESDPAAVLATTATYTPSADGNYYVIATNHLAGYTDNTKKSDLVSVTTHSGTAITEPLVDLRGAKDAVVTLSVTASGKNLHYTWKESATIDGTYTDVAGATDAASLDVTITEGMDKYYKVIVHGDCGSDLESIAHVTQFVPVVQQNVTGSTVWDWTEAASVNEIKLTSSTTPKKNEGFVMANGAATVYNNANFESDKLYLEGEYIIRTEGGKLFQGQTIKFNTTVAGAVRVTFSHTGSNKPARELFINGVGTGTSVTGTSQTKTGLIEVPAGEVAITAFHVNPTDGAGQQYVRVYKIEFYVYDTERNDSWIAPGELGTICYPNGHVFTGAEVYEMAGVDENNKFVFDQVEQTEPGKPYLFVATSYDPIKLYKTTAAAEVNPIANKGMIGTFESIDLDYTDARATKWYYFSGKKFYSVSKRTSDLNVPANRAYVDLNTPAPAGAPKHGVRRITFDVQGTNIATGVENAAATDKPAKMLINGQLFILRGEKMYDAKGQLVK